MDASRTPPFPDPSPTGASPGSATPQPGHVELEPEDIELRIGRFLAGNPVLPGAAFELTAQARHLLGAARAEAQAMLAQARAQSDALRTEAQLLRQSEARRGFNEGVEQGRREHARTVATAGVEQARSLPDMNERIGLLVTRTLNKILSEQHNDQRFFVAVTERVLRAAREEKFLRMRVSGSQRVAAQAAVDQVLRDSGAPNLIEVVADDGLRSGACLVESPHGVIDASLDTQLEGIRQALTTVWRNPGAAASG